MNNRPTFTPDQTVDQTQYYWFQNGFTEEEVDRIISLAAKHKEQDATIIGNDKNVEEAIRKSKVRWLPNDSTWSWLYDRIADMSVEANNALWHFDLHTILDDIQFTEYKAGGGHYDWHVDIGPSTISHRKISVVVQLSDDEAYVGGDLELMPGNHSFAVPRKKGAVAIFPSFMLHRVTPVTKGLRRSLVLWVGGSHYR
jgi:PKHD-type hydroxylase